MGHACCSHWTGCGTAAAAGDRREERRKKYPDLKEGYICKYLRG
jgi:hypothetical protein